jgi:hypothetical protein
VTGRLNALALLLVAVGIFLDLGRASCFCSILLCFGRPLLHGAIVELQEKIGVLLAWHYFLASRRWCALTKMFLASFLSLNKLIVDRKVKKIASGKGYARSMRKILALIMGNRTLRSRTGCSQSWILDGQTRLCGSPVYSNETQFPISGSSYLDCIFF